MSATAVAMTIEAVVLALAVLFVVALLRSHAEILRRLAQLEEAGGEQPRLGAPRPTGLGATAAPDIAGQTLNGDAVKVALGRGSPDTLLAFLSSGCGPCEPLWSAVRAGARGPDATRLIVVTKGPGSESLSRLKELSTPGVDTVMSTEAWDAYSVPSTPHFVLVDGHTAQIAGRGSATSWEQLLTLVEQATADSAEHGRWGKSSSARARRAEEALAAAGISADHPSLYPSRRPEPQETGAPEEARR